MPEIKTKLCQWGLSQGLLRVSLTLHRLHLCLNATDRTTFLRYIFPLNIFDYSTLEIGSLYFLPNLRDQSHCILSDTTEQNKACVHRTTQTAIFMSGGREQQSGQAGTQLVRIFHVAEQAYLIRLSKTDGGLRKLKS